MGKWSCKQKTVESRMSKPYCWRHLFLLGEEKGLEDGEIVIIVRVYRECLSPTGYKDSVWKICHCSILIRNVWLQLAKLWSHSLWDFESMTALSALHGKQIAKEIWLIPSVVVEQMRETIFELISLVTMNVRATISCYRWSGTQRSKRVDTVSQWKWVFKVRFVDEQTLVKLGFVSGSEGVLNLVRLVRIR